MLSRMCENRPARCRHLALLGFIAATTGLAQAASLVNNGGMEVPAIAPGTILTVYAGQTFGDWTVSAGSIDVVHSWQNAEGLQSIDLSGSSQGTIYQDVPTVPGQTYNLSFAMASDPYRAGIRDMDVYWGGVLVDSLSFATAGHTDQDMGWMYHSYMLTATGTVTRLLFKDMTHDNDGYYGAALDDVVLTPVPGDLLQNPGAESGDLAYWTVEPSGLVQAVQTASQSTGTVEPNSGTYFFSFLGFPASSGKMRQEVSLTGVNTGSITAGGRVQTEGLGTLPDCGELVLDFYDAGGQIIGTASSGLIGNPVWGDAYLGAAGFADFSVTAAIPGGATKVRYTMNGYLRYGSWINLFLDDLYLTACEPPSITQQPAVSPVKVGQVVTLSVAARGTSPLSYQWRKDGNNLSDEGRISGSTTATLTINPAQAEDGGVYDVLVSNACGSVNSDPVTLAVQQSVSSIQGLIIDQSNAQPVVSAVVSTPGFPSVQTGQDGTFQYSAIPIGTYTLTASRSGYQTVSCQAKLIEGRPTFVYLSMVPVSPQGQLALGLLTITGGSITKTGDCIWQINENAMINGVLRCTGTLTANTCTSRLRGDGQIWVDNVPILGSVRLYEGKWEFDGSKALTTAINAWLSDVEMTGMKVHITSIGLVGTTARAQGYITLPKDMGGGKIDVAGSHYLEVSSAHGLVYDFTIEKQLDLLVGGFNFTARSSSIYLSNAGGQNVCRIYGVYELSDFLGGVTVNLDPGQGNYFSISKAGDTVRVDIVGSLAVGEVTITPGIYARNLFLSMDTVSGNYLATGTVGFPMGTTRVDVNGTLGIVGGYFDSASLTAYFDPAYPILFTSPPPIPVVYLTSVGAGISNLSPKSNKAVVLQITGGFQGGPEFFGYRLVELDLTGTVDLSGSVRGDAVLKLGNNAEDNPIITGNATVILDLKNGMYLALSVEKQLQGEPFLSLSGNAMVDLGNNFAGSLNGSVVIPTNVPIVGAIMGGQTVSAQAYAQAINDADNTNDYLAVGFTVVVDVPVVGEVEMKPAIEISLANNQINWAGSWDHIKDVDFPGAGSAPKSVLAAPTPPESFAVAPNVDYVIFRATWEAGATDLHLVDPGGQTITPANVGGFNGMRYYTNGDPKEAFYVIKQPMAGTWQLILSEQMGIGAHALQQLQESVKPTIGLLSPSVDTTDTVVNITWTDAGLDDARISLYYDSDRTGANGTLIAKDISRSDPGNSYLWDTAGVPSGAYYVYALIADGRNTPRVSYSVGRVFVSDPSAPTPPTNVTTASTETPGELAVSWSASTDPGVDHYDVYYTPDAAGEGMPNIAGGGSGTSVVLTGLPPGKTYRLAVAGVNAAGRKGALSQPVLATVALPVNNPPAWQGRLPSQATVGLAYQFQVLASDLDGDPVTYSLVGQPAGMTISPTGLVDWTPATNQVGIQTFTIALDDQRGGTNQRAFSVRVAENTVENRPPEILSEAPAGTVPGTSYNYAVQAVDPDVGDSLTYQLLSGPSGATMAGNVVNWTAGSTSGWYEFTVMVSDTHGLFDLQRFSVLVDGNAPSPHTPCGEVEGRTTNTITLRAYAAVDSTGPVQFQLIRTGVPVPPYQDSPVFVAESLLPNTPYSLRVRCRDRAAVVHQSAPFIGTVVAYTLADAPAAPAFISADLSSVDITLSAGVNPATTSLTLWNASTQQWVGLDGLPSATAVWADAATWGTVKVSGLSSDTSYCLQCKARNGENLESDFGPALTAQTLAQDSRLDLSSNRIWVYENLSGSNQIRLVLTSQFVNDPYGNTGYTYEWQVFPNPVTGRSFSVMSGGGTTDSTITLAAPEASANHPGSYLVSCRMTGAQAGNSVSKTLSIEVRKLVRADLDMDGDVDAADFSRFISCARGPAVPQTFPPCVAADFDTDGDVDADDFAVFQRCWSGSLPADPNCAN